jgi:hypothetical protein
MSKTKCYNICDHCGEVIEEKVRRFFATIDDVDITVVEDCCRFIKGFIVNSVFTCTKCWMKNED